MWEDACLLPTSLRGAAHRIVSHWNPEAAPCGPTPGSVAPCLRSPLHSRLDRRLEQVQMPSFCPIHQKHVQLQELLLWGSCSQGHRPFHWACPSLPAGHWDHLKLRKPLQIQSLLFHNYQPLSARVQSAIKNVC